MGAAPEWNAVAPIIRVALQRNESACLEIVDYVGRGGNRDCIKAGLGKIQSFPLRFFQNRPQPDDQREFPVINIESEANCSRAGCLGLFNFAPSAMVARMTDSAQCFKGPEHILDSDRGSIGESRFSPNCEFHPFAIRTRLD